MANNLNCNSFLSSFPREMSCNQNYYRELLFLQILKNKFISDDSFKNLYEISETSIIDSISDTKGNFQFKVERPEKGEVRCIIDDTQKKFQLKVDFYGRLGRETGFIIVDYELITTTAS